MKRLNKFFIQTESEEEYNKIGDTFLHSYFDVSLYLKYLNSKESNALNNLILENMKIWDHYNVILNFAEVKRTFKIEGDFAIFNKNNPDYKQIKINKDCIKISNEKANKICRDLHEIIYLFTIKLDGGKIVLWIKF